MDSTRHAICIEVAIGAKEDDVHERKLAGSILEVVEEILDIIAKDVKRPTKPLSGSAQNSKILL